MKLLLITQAIDENNPILSFFMSWVKEFSERYEKVIVICLEEGRHDLPEKTLLSKEEYLEKLKKNWEETAKMVS